MVKKEKLTELWFQHYWNNNYVLYWDIWNIHVYLDDNIVEMWSQDWELKSEEQLKKIVESWNNLFCYIEYWE